MVPNEETPTFSQKGRIPLGDNASEQAAEGTRTDRHGVVAVIRQGERLLIIRRSESVAAPGQYCFPGGAVEPNETEEQALVRELWEELGVTIEPVRRIWQSVTDWGVRLSWWHGRIRGDAQPNPNSAEVAEVAWRTIREILALPELLTSNREFLTKLASGEIKLPDENLGGEGPAS